MGVKSKDREWMPRPDQNHLSWSFAFAVLAGFFICFTAMALICRFIPRHIRYMRLPVSSSHFDNFDGGNGAGQKAHQPHLASTTMIDNKASLPSIGPGVGRGSGPIGRSRGTIYSTVSAADVSAKVRFIILTPIIDLCLIFTFFWQIRK